MKKILILLFLVIYNVVSIKIKKEAVLKCLKDLNYTIKDKAENLFNDNDVIEIITNLLLTKGISAALDFCDTLGIKPICETMLLPYINPGPF